MIMSYSEGEASNSSNIDENELCDKIQKLMLNIKTICSPGDDSPSPSNKEISRMDDITNRNNCSTPNQSSKLSTNFSETSSFNCDVSISSLSEDDDNDETTVLLKSNDFMKNSDTNPELTIIDSASKSNLIPQRTLNKILVLEDLISSIRNKMKNEYYPSFKILQDEFEDLKQKLKIGTKYDLPEQEVINIMNRLKLLFENLIQFQNDTSVDKNEVFMQNINNTDIYYKPAIKPRLNRLKTPKIVTKNTSSLDDLPKLIEYIDSPLINKRKVGIDPKIIEYQPNVTLYNYNGEELKQTCFDELPLSNSNTPSNFPYQIKKKSLLSSSLDLSKSAADLHENDNLHNSSFKSTKNILERIGSLNNSKSKSVSNIPRLINVRDGNGRNNSRLPVLKKDSTKIRENTEKLSKISYMSEVVTNQVIGNLKRLGLVKKKIDCACETARQAKSPVKTKAEVSLLSKNRCNSELALNIPCHMKRKQYPTKVQVDKEENKTFPQSCYLTKIDSNRLKKHCLNDNGLVSTKNARIYNLQTLLKKNKYKIVTENDKVEVFQCSMPEVYKNHDSSEDTMDFDKLVALIGNTFRVIHQLVMYPLNIITSSQSANLNNSSSTFANQPFLHCPNSQRDPRLVHIGKACSCKINTLQTKKELLRRRVQPPLGFGKSLVLLDIHYDIRKGKPLGCLKLLRQLTGSEMKIFRSSILLPGGYIKEMNSCSVNELVNMSNKHDGIVQTFQQKPPKSKFTSVSKSASITNSSTTNSNQTPTTTATNTKTINSNKKIKTKSNLTV